MDHPVLERIGAYRLTKHLSASERVQAYLAHEESPSREVVLKIVQNVWAENAENIDELRREAPAIRRLNHPAIVRTYRFFEHEQSLIFVFEYVDGMSLADLMRIEQPNGHRTLSDEAVFHVAISVLNALAHAHGASSPSGTSSPVVHKGVSPSNIHVTRDGAVKLGGFGFIHPFGIRFDRTGKVEWESAYMAPEQIAGQPLTQKVDVYAAGLILWELLTGRPPRVLPRDPLALEALSSVVERGPPPLVSLRPDLPPEVLAAVDGALVLSPENRVIGCAEMAQLIRTVAQDQHGKMELQACVRAALSASESTEPVPAPAQEPVAAPEPVTSTSLAVHEVPRPRAPVPPPPVISISELDTAAEEKGGRPVAGNIPTPSAESARLPSHGPTAAAIPPVLPISVSAGFAPEPRAWNGAAAAGKHAASRRPSILQRLQTPTRWRRSTWLSAWLALGIALAAVIIKLAIDRPTKRPSLFATKTPPAPTQTAPVAPSKGPPEVQALPGPEPTPSAPQPASSAEEPPDALPGPGFAYLTVHSSRSSANVYLTQKYYGPAEGKLIVPCGVHYLAIGVPAPNGKETTWLAPGRMMKIPCGESVEVTMNPGARK